MNIKEKILDIYRKAVKQYTLLGIECVYPDIKIIKNFINLLAEYLRHRTKNDGINILYNTNGFNNFMILGYSTEKIKEMQDYLNSVEYIKDTNDIANYYLFGSKKDRKDILDIYKKAIEICFVHNHIIEGVTDENLVKIFSSLLIEYLIKNIDNTQIYDIDCERDSYTFIVRSSGKYMKIDEMNRFFQTHEFKINMQNLYIITIYKLYKKLYKQTYKRIKWI